MVRKQLYIEKAQDMLIKELAAKYGVSEAHIVRTAIDDLSKAHLPKTEEVDLSCWEAEAQFIRSRFSLVAEDDHQARHWTRDEIHER